MSIATELTKLLSRRDSIVTAITTQGGTCPAGASLADCAAAIATIPGGSSGSDNYLIPLFNRTIETIELPGGIVQIPEYMFYKAYRLKSIVIPDTVTSIGNQAFNSCALISLEIPDSVTDLGHWTFMSNNNLVSVSISANVTMLKAQLFRGCGSLKRLTVRASVPPVLDSTALNTATALEHIYVPAIAVESYKSATNWSAYADIISAID